MKELTYNSCLFYSLDLFSMIIMQINNILILVKNNFACKKETAIKIAKIITKV